MSRIHTGRRRDDTSSPAIALMVKRFEADWRGSPSMRADPIDYLPRDSRERPAALLALLRADLALRWKAHEQCPLERYRDYYPELDGDSLVALLYEEYCLREEAGESPQVVEYSARFPDIAESFREVLEIHALFGRSGALASRWPSTNGVPLPEAGQTIAGFRLVEELGRGAFARVYLAEERHLADRPVALKVTRTGSREPQTLARLQHTHIVPVYSYRTDAATGLHLLCMPYLGRITLLHILNHPEIRTVRTGADLLRLLDRLQPSDAAVAEQAATRAALARRSYAQAIAWWGARLAEALQHAHDHQVFHRDVKPSNVLVSGDGLPMLLDFNLAQEPVIDHAEAAGAAVRGTLAYMAPEQLDALAKGGSHLVDSRTDLYALGVVLFDCLVKGTRMFAFPSTTMTMTSALVRTADDRRAGLPSLRATHPEVSPALEAVVHHCLAPDPADRYASAAQLAADLQAVADGEPLRYAREPIPSRCFRWLRRNRVRLAVAGPVILILGAFAYSQIGGQLAALRREAEVRRWADMGRRAADDGQLELAASQYATALQLGEGDNRLSQLLEGVKERHERVLLTKGTSAKIDELLTAAERLHFSLLGFSSDPKIACRAVERALAKFSIPDDRDWMRQTRLDVLDEPRLHRFISAINELLFLWVYALDGDPEGARRAVRICDVAVAFATPTGPWRAMRQRAAARLAGEPPPSRPATSTESETLARGCFQWALLCDLEGKTEAVVAWLERATRLEPKDYWSHFYLGLFCSRIGQKGRAMEHYQAAVALRPDSPWARCNRALLYHARGEWDLALDDLNLALASPQAADLPEAKLALGLVKQVLGDDAGARAAYADLITTGHGNPFVAAGRLNRAKLDIDQGAIDRAWAEYDALLLEDPRDAPARLSRALLALRFGRPALAEADLTSLLQQDPERAGEILASRARARLALGRLEEAESDAAGAYRRKPSPSRERLWIRTLLALHRVEDLLWLNRPEDLTMLPGGESSLTGDLRAAEKRFDSLAQAQQPGGTTSPIHRARAVVLCALDEPAALGEASRALALAPESSDAYLVRARVRRKVGDRRAALADVESALSRAPGDPRLLELRGMLKIETGNPRAALVDLDRAVLRGAPVTVRVPRALALEALGQHDAAVREWSLALDADPEDAEAYLGRATALLRLHRTDRALVDLEQAADWAAFNPVLLPRITVTYALCLGSRPDRFSRWLRLARRACSAWMAAPRPGLGTVAAAPHASSDHDL
jgi:serine/threonine protein kinase/Tfp pilus assembly protein PilF